MRRAAAWKPISIVAVASLGLAGLGGFSANAAEGDPSQALADVLNVDLLGGELLNAGQAYASVPGGPPSDDAPLDLDLLGGVDVVSGSVTLPLLADGATPGLLDLGQLGALSNYAATSSTSSAIASSGLVSDDGAIALDADELPPTASNASIDVTSLLSQLGVDGVTEGIVDELALQIGAVASRAVAEGDGVTSEYRVADLGLQLHSELVGDLSTTLRSTVDGLETPVNTTLNGLGTTVTDTLNAIDLTVPGLASVSLGGSTVSVTLADLSSTLDTVLGENAVLVSDDESVTINLTDGSIDVDLAQIVNPDGVGLNDMGPNTSVLTAETIDSLTAGVSNALGKIVTPVTNAVSELIEDSAVTITVPVSASASISLIPFAPPIVIPVISGDLKISGTLGEITSGEGEISNSLAILPDLGAVSGILNPLLQSLTTAVVDGVANPLLAALDPAVDGLLAATAEQVEAALQGVVTTVTSTLSPVLDGVVSEVATVTINAQPTELASPQPADIPGGFTVRALQIELLPNLGTAPLASIGLASSSVTAQAVLDEPVFATTPDRVHAGDQVTVGGAGWDPASSVEVVFTNSADVQVGTALSLPPLDSGVIAGTFTVPAGTPPGVLTATATQGDDELSDTVEVVADPAVTVDPNPAAPEAPVTIEGSGFLCGPVTVTINDGDTVLDTIEDVAVDADGSWTTEWAVPADIDVASLTIEALAADCGDAAETELEIDLPETFSVAPEQVRAGDAVAIAGGGWDPASPVTVVFTDAEDDAVGQPVLVTPTEDGTLDGAFTVPVGTASGLLTATATQGDDELTDTVTVFDGASIEVTPGATRAGTTVQLDGAGWLPGGGDVTVTFTDADDAPVGAPVVITAIAADGTITGEFAVPEGTDAGTLVATAVQGDADALDTLVVLAEPSVTVDPSTVRPGGDVTIGGGGWTDGSPVTVIVTDADGDPVGAPVELTPVGGVIDGIFPVPEGTEPGDLTVTATQGVDEATDELVVTLAPTLSASPERLHAGDEITIGGGGWDSSAPVSVAIIDADDVTLDTVEITPVDGVLTGAYTVPEGTDPGTLSLVATQGDDTASDTVEVVADPAVVVTPEPADPGSPITIEGSGFLCGPVTVTISDGATVLETIEDVIVGADGSWTTTWTVPAGTDASSLTISAVAAACDDEAETELEIDLPESLTVAPDRVRAGDEVAIGGGGWDDGSPVTVVFENAAGEPVGEPVEITPLADGSITGAFTVPAGTPIGVLTATATQGDDSETDDVLVLGEPAVVVDPNPAEPDAPITIDGSGFACGPVTVTISDGDTVVETIEDVVVGADGTWSTEWTVPAGTDAASLTIAAIAAVCDDEAETELEVDLPETLTVSPEQVRPGDEVAIGGGGWDAGSPVTVEFTDEAGDPVGEPVLVTPAEDGSLDGTFTVPAGTPAGPLTATATQGDDSDEGTVTVFDAPSIAVTPEATRADTTVALNGGGWLPDGGDVTVTFTDADGDTVGLPVVVTEIADDGTIAAVFAVPEGTEPGELTATAVQGDADASDTLLVLDEPSLTVEPGTAHPGDEVAIGGAAWADDSPVTVVFTDADDAPVGEPVVLTPVDGVLDGSFVVPEGTEPGTLTATATQGADSATDELEVTPAPTVSVFPGQVRPGDTIAIGGEDWIPGSPVTLVFTDADGDPVGEPVPVSPAEDGSLDGTFTVPPGTPAGPLTATATQGDDSAEDTVAVFDAASIAVTPEATRAGTTVALNGGGWLPAGGDVTVTFTDADDNAVGEPVVITEIAEDGTVVGEFAVPEGTEPGTLIATAAQDGIEALDALAVLAEPSVVVDPTTVRPGDEVSIGGAGWTDGSPVTVIVTDAAGDPVGEPVVIDPVDGVLDGTFTVPPGTPAGELTVTATQGDDEATDELIVTLAPVVSLDPGQVRPGDSVAIAGGGWDPASAVTVVFTDANGAPAGEPVEIDPADDGSLDGAFTVPAGTPVGALTATATQDDDSATDAVVVLAEPAVVVEPNPAAPGEAIVITGSGFACGPVSVTISDGDTVLESIEGVIVAPDGSWATTWSVPADVDVASLTVTALAAACDDEAETVLAIDLPETLTLTPEQVRPGDAVAIGGGGWDALQPVVVVFTDADGEQVGEPVTLIAGVDGVIDGEFTVPGGAPAGVLNATATQGDDSAIASVEVLAVPVVIVDPEGPVTPGTTVTISGGGFSCGPITVTIRTADGTLVDTLGPLELTDGAFSTEWAVPADLDPTTLSIVASAPAECDDESSTELEVVAVGTPGTPGGGSGNGGGASFPSTESGNGGTSGIPSTGTDTAAALGMTALLLLLLGTGLTVMVRRRREVASGE